MSEKVNKMTTSNRGFGRGRGPGIGMPVEKAKDFKGTLKRLMGYLEPRKVSLILVFIMAILSTLFNTIGPKVMGLATTKLFEGSMVMAKGIPGAAIDFNYILNIIKILIILYLVSSIFNYIMQYIMASVSQKTVYELRKEVSDKLAVLPLKYYDSRSHGEILSRVTNDVDNISSTLQQSLTQFITSIVTIISVVLMMLIISPLLTVITFVTLPISFMITKKVAMKSQKYFKNQQMEIGKVNGHVEEMYTGHQIVRVYNHEEKSIQKFNEINDRLYDAGWRAQFISGIIMPLMMFVSNIGYVFISVVGGILVTKRAIEIGDIQAFIQYTRQFSHPIMNTANIANVIQSTIASAERVFEILDEVEEIKDLEETKVINEPKGNVRFDHVRFGYTEDILIHDMNLDVKKGQTIAIVGPTGAGKTTLVNLLMRFYEINDGKITIDGVDITELKRGNLRTLFGMVLQDTWLFKGSIRENIAYGKAGATEKEIISASKAANADHFIRTLSDGYDTILNEDANNISQGQKQLITIARAILADPLILILDEATSSVDTRTEMAIQSAMTSLMKGRTSFVIAHRLSTIKDADMILVMSQGDIIEKGNHCELIEKNGFYAELYNSQYTGRN